MLLIGVDAQVAGNLQRFLDDLARCQLGVFQQRTRRRLSVGTAAADGDDALLGLQHVTIAGDHQRVVTIGHRQHGLQAAQHAIGAPVLGEFHRRAQQMALVFFQLGFEAFKQREGIGRATGKAGQDAFVVEAAHLARAGLDDDVAQSHLAIATEGDMLATSHREYGGTAILFHESP